MTWISLAPYRIGIYIYIYDQYWMYFIKRLAPMYLLVGPQRWNRTGDGERKRLEEELYAEKLIKIEVPDILQTWLTFIFSEMVLSSKHNVVLKMLRYLIFVPLRPIQRQCRYAIYQLPMVICNRPNFDVEIPVENFIIGQISTQLRRRNLIEIRSKI